MLYGANSIRDLVGRMDRYECRRNQTSVSRPAISRVDPIYELLSTVCFNCSKFGHFRSACSKPLRLVGSCFNCHQMGHTHKEYHRKIQRVTAIHHLGDVVQSVSVAFQYSDQGGFSDFSIFSSMFDSGSPVILIRKSAVPLD